MNYISYAVICGAEALISWLYFTYLFEQKYSKSFALATVICGYSLCFLIYQLNITAMNLFSFFIVNFFIAKSNYNCRIKTAVLHSAFLSFIMGISEIAVAATMDLFNQDFTIYISDIHIMFIMTILSKSLYLLLAALGAKLFKPHKRYGDEPRPMLAFCLIPVFSMVVSLMVAYVGLNIELTKAAELMIIVTFISLLFVNLILFVIYNYVIKTNYNYTRLELINQKDRTNAEYYKSLYENTENQRLLIHDMKHHLDVIGGLAKSSGNLEIASYISNIINTSEINEHKRFTENPILNVILKQYYQKCINSNIVFEADVRSDCLDFMDTARITAIFDNLLSNAYEAAAESNDKKIELSVIKYDESHTVTVSVINSCDRNPVKDRNGIYKTTKESGLNHGYGLKSISRAVDSYNGTSMFYYDKVLKQFHTVIQLPYYNR